VERASGGYSPHEIWLASTKWALLAVVLQTDEEMSELSFSLDIRDWVAIVLRAHRCFAMHTVQSARWLK
jgi:hypothetical protein